MSMPTLLPMSWPRAVRGAAADPSSPTLINSTEPGRVMGTPSYMAPDQVRGESADHRADIFAFGCVLYEMLSGARAFRRNTPVESMNAVLNDALPELSTTNLDVGLLRKAAHFPPNWSRS